MFIRKSILFTLAILMISALLLPPLANALSIADLKNIVNAVLTTIDEAKKAYDDHIEWEAKMRVKANKWKNDADTYYPKVTAAFDNYEFYSDWLGGAQTARDAAQSRINYALDMLYQLGGPNSQNEQAIKEWEAELKSAREEHKIQTQLIDNITPDYESAKKEYDSKYSIWNGKYKIYSFYDQKATDHLVSSGWLAVSIKNYYNDIIKEYNDNPDLGPCPDYYHQQVTFWSGLTLGLDGNTT